LSGVKKDVGMWTEGRRGGKMGGNEEQI